MPPKFNWSQKKKETRTIAADYSDKQATVEDDDYEEARAYGRDELGGFNQQIANIQESLHWKPYIRSFGKNPSSSQIVHLKGAIDESFIQYESKSAEIAAREADLAATEAATRGKNIDRPIIERGAPSPFQDVGLNEPPVARGAPSPALSVASINSRTSFLRSPTPQTMPAGLSPPPRSHRRRFSLSQDNAQPELAAASSSGYTSPAAMDSAIYRAGHRRTNTRGQSQRYSIDTCVSNQISEMPEEYEQRSEEEETK